MWFLFLMARYITSDLGFKTFFLVISVDQVFHFILHPMFFSFPRLPLCQSLSQSKLLSP